MHNREIFSIFFKDIYIYICKLNGHTFRKAILPFSVLTPFPTGDDFLKEVLS